MYFSFSYFLSPMNFPGGSDGKASAYNAGDPGSIPGLGRSPGKGNGNPLQYSFLPGKFHGWKSLVGYSPWGCKESDTTEQLHWSVAHQGSPLLSLLNSQQDSSSKKPSWMQASSNPVGTWIDASYPYSGETTTILAHPEPISFQADPNAGTSNH